MLQWSKKIFYRLCIISAFPDDKKVLSYTTGIRFYPCSLTKIIFCKTDLFSWTVLKVLETVPGLLRFQKHVTVARRKEGNSVDSIFIYVSFQISRYWI